MSESGCEFTPTLLYLCVRCVSVKWQWRLSLCVWCIWNMNRPLWYSDTTMMMSFLGYTRLGLYHLMMMMMILMVSFESFVSIRTIWISHTLVITCFSFAHLDTSLICVKRSLLLLIVGWNIKLYIVSICFYFEWC